MREIDNRDNLDNFEHFIRIHQEHGLELRYLPQSKEQFHARISNTLRGQEVVILVDFGIINGRLLYGQELPRATATKTIQAEYVTSKPTLVEQYLHDATATESMAAGHVRSQPTLVDQYVRAYQEIWNQTKSHSFPIEQLVALHKFMSMRRRRLQGPTPPWKRGEAFFVEVVEKIRTAKSLRAVDVTDDMTNWFHFDEYIDFLWATVAAKENNPDGHFSRLYVFNRPFVNQVNAKLFVKEVLVPQLKVGIEIAIGYRGALVDGNVAAIDLICDDAGWGFYLLPGDRFGRGNVSEVQNLIDRTMHQDFVQLHDDLKEVLRKSERCAVLKGSDTMDEARLIALLTYPDHTIISP
ncbi:MAG: hypothetical protein ABSC37_21950 [Xanthobacteraceae bacterium]